MSAKNLLDRLQAQGIEVWCEAGKLRYRASKGRMTAVLRAEMSAARDGLIRLLNPEPELGTIDLPQTLPLSPIQTGLWFFHELDSQSTYYNGGRAYLLHGPLDSNRLAAAFEQVSSRHQALQTRFADHDGTPSQQVDPSTIVKLQIAEQPNGDPLTTARTRYLTLMAQPFDLTSGPPMRLELTRLTEHSHVLVLVLHHIISDGLSMNALVYEMTEIYRALQAERAPALPTLSVQYPDYTLWMNHRLEGGYLKDQLAWWKEQLAQPLPTLQLPQDGDDLDDFRGETVEASIKPKLLATLTTLTREQGATLYMTLLAGYQILLHRLSGADDLIVGTPSGGRNRPDLEPLIGCFLNTLALRSRLPDARQTSIRAYLDHVRQTTLEAYANDEVPFEYLVKTIQPKRGLARNPLFDVLFNFVNEPTLPTELDELSIEPVTLPVPDSMFLITLLVQQEEQALKLRLTYRTALFTRERMTGILDQYVYLLEQVAARPEATLAHLSLVTPAMASILPSLNQALEVPNYLPVANAVHQMALAHPTAPAIEWDGNTKTYQQLTAAATCLAHQLHAKGLEAGEVVAITGPNGYQRIAAILGTLLARGVLLTLDPELPPQRRALMLATAEVRIALSSGGPAPDLPFADPVLALLEGPQPSADHALPLAKGHEPAYLFFTSGTSGTPKAVLGQHKALAHFIAWQGASFGVGPGDRCAQLTGLSFDVVLRDIFLPLTTGATLCLPNPDQQAAPLHWMEQARISHSHVVPSLLQAWLDQLETPLDQPHVRLLFFAGEPLSAELVTRCRTQISEKLAIVNLYGPTETTLARCYYRVPQQMRPGIQPVGKPIPQSQAHVLAEQNRHCGIGERGEIVIRTPFRSLGYLKAADPCFRPNPYTNEAADQLYFTGDAGRYLPDGNLEILGRLDHQIKIMGVRIEPAEIEAALERQPQLTRAAVVPIETEAGKRLLAYVVPEGAAIPAAILREQLRASLPEIMIPTAIMTLSSLPLQPNGKLDRTALPEYVPEREQPASHTTDSPDQHLLAEIWRELLKLDSQPGHQEDFFALGGYSLVATRLVARIRTDFEVEIKVRAVFEHPTIETLTRHIHSQRGALPLPPIQRADRDQPLPLSFAQERVWFIDQLAGPDPTYNMPTWLHLTGWLDVAALESAFNALLARHEVLRTRYPASEGQATQELMRPALHQLPLNDLSQLHPEERQTAAERLVHLDAGAPFELAHGPLFRVALYRLSPILHVLLVTMHHIVSDYWSQAVMVREIVQDYNARLTDGAASPPDLPIQYADFAAWQRNWMSGDELQQQLNYWSKHLDGAPDLIALPTDRTRPAVLNNRGARVNFQLDHSMIEQLHALSREQRASLYISLFAAFNLLLSNYTGEDDLVVGTVTANRRHRESEPLIGYFANTLAMRFDLTGNPSYTDLIQRVRSEVLNAFSHQDLPFEKLVEELKPTRNLSQTPLIQVMFVLQNIQVDELALMGVNVVPQPRTLDVSHLDLSLVVTPSPDGHASFLEYNTNLFDAATIQAMAGHYRTLIQHLIAEPHRPRSTQTCLDEQERTRLLSEWSTPQQQTAEPARCVHDMFEAVAIRNDMSLALAFLPDREHGSIEQMRVYLQVDMTIKGIADRISTLGIVPEMVVGIYCERSLFYIKTILATLRLGGIFLPLDITWPMARLAEVVEDANPKLILTESHLCNRLTPLNRPQHVLDGLRAKHSPLVGLAPTRTVVPQNLAYLIYTSGSTGKPKGVAVTHASLSMLVAGAVKRWEIGPGDRCLQFVTFSFDAALYDTLTTLCSGAALYVVDQKASTRSDKILDYLEEHEISHISIPTPLLEAMPYRELPKLRMITVGSDALSAEVMSRWGRNRTLRHAYGPTETTVIVVTYRIDDSKGVEGKPPIGRPNNPARTYVLDTYMQPTPASVPGELYIGGQSLARGYHGQPAQTANRFVPDPYTEEPGGRLYRSGDRVRYRQAASPPVLEFLGRYDYQVKIRGYRIEPNEVAASLASASGVDRCVVVASPEARKGSNAKRLVAFVVPQEKATNQLETQITMEISRHLAHRLPAYMLPSRIIVLAALPLKRNGKLDRAALNALASKPQRQADKLTTSSLEAPRGTMEKTVARHWCDQLGLEQVGRNQNFFELGGHSLQATRMVSQLQECYGPSATLALLFETENLGAYCERLQLLTTNETTDKSTSTSLQPTLKQMARQPEAAGIQRAPLSFAQERLWFLERLDDLGSTYHVTMRLRFEGHLDVAALETALNGLIERHEVLRTAVSLQEPETLISPSHKENLTLIELRHLKGARQTARKIAGMAATKRFHLEEAPLLRVQALRLTESEVWLQLTLHHLICDAWTTALLMKELAHYYRAGLEKKEPDLEPQEQHYADYAHSQRQWLQGEPLAKLSRYWTEHLAEAPTQLNLPIDHPRPARQNFEGAVSPFLLGIPLSQGIREASATHRITPFMYFHAVLATLLARYSAQEQIIIGTAIANREMQKTQTIAGFFTNTIAMQLKVTPAASFADLFAQTRRVNHAAQEHQAMPFEKLVEAMNLPRDASRPPLFQVMLVLQDVHGQELQLPGLRVMNLGAQATTAKFEITIFLRDGKDGFTGYLEYNRTLFEASSMARMADLYVRLAGIARDGTATLGSDLLSPEARRYQLETLNATETPRRKSRLVHQVFEERTAQAPHSPALHYPAHRGEPQRTYSYQQVESRANYMAHKLREKGVRPGHIVALTVARSPEMIIAIIGILKAGAAVLPLDPAQPAKRRAQMQRQARVKINITQGKQDQPDEAGQTKLDIEAMSGEASKGPPQNIDGSYPFYVLFTSGTTGTPKGVVLPHRAIVNLMEWHQHSLPGEAGYLQFAAIGFDVSFAEIWASYNRGGCLYLIPEDWRYETQALVGYLHQQNIRRAILPVALLQSWAEQWQHYKSQLSQLQEITATGEQLSITPALRRMFADLPKCRLHNHYGPTETHVVTAYSLDPDPAQWPAHVPIGRPIHNTQIYILDKQLEPVPQGAEAELYIAGTQLADGYVGQGAQTAERYLPNPFATIDQPGTRIYRSGDLARYHNAEQHGEGCISYQGRIDKQVKLRGYRVEPGEVERALNQQQGVAQAVVQPWQRPGGDLQLVAWIVASEGAELDMAQMRKRLATHIPAYMIPSQIQRVTALPMNQNGKLDRKRLPEPEAKEQEPYQAPRGEVEEGLARIFEELLKKERVSREANFFEQGGHSLLATRLVTQIHKTQQVEVTVREVFEQPTIKEMAQRVERRGENQQPEIPKADRSAPLPLSFGQTRMWYLHSLGEDSGCHLPGVIRMTGSLDVKAFEQAINAIIARHEILRTHYEEAEGIPNQQISPHQPQKLPVVALTKPSDETVRSLIDAQNLAPFDLSKGPPLHVQLIRHEKEHLFLYTLHHIASDGWSGALFVEELSRNYGQALRGQRPTAAALTHQYADIASWQRQTFDEARLEQESAWWLEQLAEAPARLTLAERSTAKSGGQEGRQPIPLQPEHRAGLHRWGQDQGATPFMTLMAVTANLLARFASQETIVFGVPIANRTRAELDPLIGLFVNLLALPVTVQQQQSYKEQLATVRQQTLDAFSHKEMPFDRLVAKLNLPHELDHAPVYQVIMLMQNNEQRQLELPLLKMQHERAASLPARNELVFAFQPGQEAFLAYDRNLYTAAYIQRMAQHFATLLEAIWRAPEAPLHSLTSLPEQERRQLLESWQNQETNPPYDTSLQKQIEAWTKANPKLIALCDVDEKGQQNQVEYGQMHRQVTGLAQELRRQGIGPETIVAVHCTNGVNMVQTWLAIHKAGAAIMPLDPSLPTRRKQEMVEDAKPRMILHDDSEETKFEGAKLDVRGIAAAQETGPTQDMPEAQQLAYIIFTSGTRGRAKGVQLTHRALANCIRIYMKLMEMQPGDRLLRLISSGFDAAVAEVYVTLCSGATLYSRHASMRQESPQPYWQTHQITHSLLPASQLPQIEDMGKLAIRTLMSGGETITVQQAKRIASQSRLINAYGPTEGTIGTTYAQLNTEQEEIPIGHAHPGITVYVLDPYQQPVPAGAVGELCIGGQGLGRGYLSAAQTAAVYQPNPYTHRAGERLYRSGDRVRYLTQGTLPEDAPPLHYQGRQDGQVKLRGYRIEIGEIVAKLEQVEQVTEAAVVLGKIRDQPQLLAYIISPQQQTAEELRRHLAERLPAYMVPAVITQIPSLPRTVNGKLDQKALPQPEDEDKAYEAPSGAAEQTLAEIWAKLLKQPRVSAGDHYFEQGGHSLLAARLVAHLREAGYEITVRQIFEKPRLREMASQLTRRKPTSEIPEAKNRRMVPLSHAQRRMWLAAMQAPTSPAYHIPIVLEMDGDLAVADLEQAMGAVVARHEALRTDFLNHGGTPFARLHPITAPSLTVIDLRGAGANTVEAQLAAINRRPFQLERGPLYRQQMLRTDSGHIYAVIVHHIICDGWSGSILVREFTRAYQDQLKGRPPLAQQPKLAKQYGDYALWQQSEQQQQALAKDRQWWLEQLRDGPRRTAFPTENQGEGEAAMASHLQHFTKGMSAKISKQSIAQGATPFMTLLSGLALLLSRTSKANDLVIGTPIAGRDHKELEPLVGLFLNLMALRIKVNWQATYQEHLGKVSELVKEGMARSQVPFDELVEQLEPAGRREQSPLFQVLFIYQNMPVEELELPGITVRHRTLGEALKYEVTLTMSERDGRIQGWWRYDTRRYKATQISALARQYEAILSHVIEMPQEPMSSLQAGNYLVNPVDDRRN